MKNKNSKKASEAPHVQVVSPGTVIRFEQPMSRRKQAAKPKVSDVAVVVAQEVNPVRGFIGFLREHSVISLAVGFAIATQAQAVVKQLIASFLDPLYALVFNGQKLSNKVVMVHLHDRAQPFAWGLFVYTLIDFVFVLAAIYAIIKLFNLDKLDKPIESVKK